jgi:pyridoxine 5-phosphate synthase
MNNTPYAIPELDLSRKQLTKMLASELENLRKLSCTTAELGIKVAAGHGLNYHNVSDIVAIETIEELNIGQSIIARSVYVGLEQAILDMKAKLIR